MRTRLLPVVAGLAALVAGVLPAAADVLIVVDKATQNMTVSRDGEPLYNWPVSTGMAGHYTPEGSYKPFRMEAEHFSKEWDDAPMPHAMFFTQQGHAIHGSNAVRNLGRIASHGCVRLSPGNATTLFTLVKAEGMGKTRIVIEGEEPISRSVAPVARRQPARPRYDRDPDYEEDLAYGYAPPRRYRPEREDGYDGGYRSYGSMSAARARNPYGEYGPY